MAEVKHVFDLLDGQAPERVGGTVAVYGVDWFLRHRALGEIIRILKISESSVQQREGDFAQWRDIHDDLASRSLFDEGGPRLTVVNMADDFVSKNRPALERWAEAPANDATLVLELDSFPGNTKLYKLVQKHGTLIQCSPPIKKGSKDAIDERAIEKWLIAWGMKQHAVAISVRQANVMVDRIGSVFGLLDTELAKVALFADANKKVTDEIVHEIVGGWRTKTAWEIADSIAEGNIGMALEQIDQLLTSGQNAVGVSAQLSWYFRRFGVATHWLIQNERMGRKVSLSAALEHAGFYRYNLSEAEKNMRRIGRDRARQLLSWLRDLDRRLKGSHSLDDRARMALEEFVLRLA